MNIDRDVWNKDGKSGELGDLRPPEVQAFLQPHRLLRLDTSIPRPCAAESPSVGAQLLHRVLRGSRENMRDVRRLPGDAGRPPSRCSRPHYQLYVHRLTGIQNGNTRKAAFMF